MMPNNSNATENAVNDSTYIVTLHEVCNWINGFIIILGLVTNSLIIAVLSRSKIGSVTTKVILLFLAVTDIVVMLLELMLHYIPNYWRWFPVYYENTCGAANLFKSASITAASWYITLMTIERFIAVWFPLKARYLCTQKTITITCICIPLICLLLYSYLLMNFESIDDNGYTMCRPSPDQNTAAFKAIMLVWISAYFFVPAVIIVTLNTAIVWQLTIAGKQQSKLTHGANYKFCTTMGCCGLMSKSWASNRSMNVVSAYKLNRKATVLVIVASVTFVLLMIPRGVSSLITKNIDWMYENKTEMTLDYITYLLQYLNHATNFFIYVLANSTFRKELLIIFHCSKPQPSSYLPTNVLSSAATTAVSLTKLDTPTEAEREDETAVEPNEEDQSL